MGAAVRPVLVDFGAHVRTLRLDRGQTLEQLAEGASLHWTYVGGVERGRRNVSLVNIVKLAEALEVDAGSLLAGLTSEGRVTPQATAAASGATKKAQPKQRRRPATAAQDD